jgi:serine/threonine protein kinase
LIHPEDLWVSLQPSSEGVGPPLRQIGLYVSSNLFFVEQKHTALVFKEFRDLPDALKLDFLSAQSTKLSSLLPHLSPPVDLAEDMTDSHFPSSNMMPTSLDLIHRLLVYPSEKRLKAREALRHPWFTSDPPMILPQSFSEASLIHRIEPSPLRRWEGKTLGEWLRAVLPGVSSQAEQFTT